jgi:hypothetical protein
MKKVMREREERERGGGKGEENRERANEFSGRLN